MTRLVGPVVSAGTMSGVEQPDLAVDSELGLRPWRLDDAPVVYRAFSTPDIQFWHSRRYESAQHATEWIEECSAGWRAEQAATWAITDQTGGAVLGRVTVHTELERGSGEVAYGAWACHSVGVFGAHRGVESMTLVDGPSASWTPLRPTRSRA